MPASWGLFQVPEVSQAEIHSFHDAHFSNASIELFNAQFLQPDYSPYDDNCYEEDEEYYEEEEDDNLGYYPDGVKRTLTDEQIAIFRHSELEALKRAEGKSTNIRQDSAVSTHAVNDVGVAGSGTDHTDPVATSASVDQGEICEVKGTKEEGELEAGSEDGEIETQLTKAEARRLKKQRSKRRKMEQRKFNPEKKPDLRKRTWDVVEAGMDSLDYDDLETGQGSAVTHTAQRRRISYDD